MTGAVAVIPARGGSKGIPRKNLQEIGGKPLVAHPIENALNAETIDRTILTTDDDQIATIGKKYGAEVPFMRPPELATDDVPVIAALQHCLRYLLNECGDLEYIVALQPTCPFTLPSDIDEAVTMARDCNCDSVVSIAKITDTHPYRTYMLDGDQLVPFKDVTVDRPLQRQNRPDVYGLTGAIFVRRPAVLDSWVNEDFALGEDVRAIVQPEERALDIDTLFELKTARALYEFNATSENKN